MDSYSLMCDFEGTCIGVSIGDFEEWLRSHFGRFESRQLLSEFIVEQSLGTTCSLPILSSDKQHSFSYAQTSSHLLLCDFPSSLSDTIHLDKWTFFLVDGNKIFGDFTVEELSAYNPPTAGYYMLYKLFQN